MPKAKEKTASKFNNGKPYHGSRAVQRGKLQGSTLETDYFYFFCPECSDKGILRILDSGVHAEESENPYNNQVTRKAKRGFTLAFQVYCEECKFTDFVKISNTGWQGGTYAEVMSQFTA